MSVWARLELSVGVRAGAEELAERIRSDFEEREVWIGSEGPPSVLLHEGVVYVDDSMRDFRDEHVAELRDWFAGELEKIKPDLSEATLRVTVDYGGRYHYVWSDDALWLQVPDLYAQAISDGSSNVVTTDDEHSTP